MSKEFTNQYDPRIPFNDNLAHFLRMNKDMVESYFAANGPLARVTAPNWAERAEDGSYELITLDSDSTISHRWGIFFTIKPKTVTKYEEGKSKAIATWDYTITVPSADEEHGFQIYSNDALKYVFAAPNGYISAIPPRMRQMQNQISTMRIRIADGDLPLMPYVNLAFFMWLEEDEAAGVREWLSGNMEGWREALGI